MDAKFFDSLFEGDSANGVKLCLGLTGGDFWARLAGCQNLYRGVSGYDIDFDAILVSRDIDEASITIPSFAGHQADSSYVYVLRRTNGCGDEEWTFRAAVRLKFDENGDIVEPACNDVFSLTAEQIEGPKVRLVWYYCPLSEGAACVSFNIYWDNGSGEIDYVNKLAAIDYAGSRYYSFETDVLSEERYQFCIRAESASAQENEHLGTVQIQIRDTLQQGVEMLEAHAV